MGKSAMAEHVRQLCEEHGITARSRVSSRGLAFSDTREISVRPVRSWITYAVALHEIGHLASPGQMGCAPCLENESDAWEWALAHSIAPFPSAAWGELYDCLALHLGHAVYLGSRMVLPNVRHAFWKTWARARYEATGERASAWSEARRIRSVRSSGLITHRYDRWQAVREAGM